MQVYEVGILPQSVGFSFSPSPQVQKNYYYQIWIGHYYCSDEYYIKRESFPPLLLVYVCHGTFHLELEKKKYNATEGKVLFFDCEQPHHYYTDNDTEFLYIHFDGPRAHELCHIINRNNGILIDGTGNDAIKKSLLDMISFYEDSRSESIFATSEKIYHLFTILDNPLNAPRLKKNDASISRAIKYIRSHVGEKMTLHQLAEIAELSDYYFSHIFKELTGQSPMEFVIYSRIDHSKLLLANTLLPISEISKQVGYPSSANYITLFTQRIGISPNQFRKLNRPKA